MKNEKNNGKDLNKSLIATSAEPETMQPTMSAKAYNILKNVKAEKTNKTMTNKATMRDCFFWVLSNVELIKFSLLNKFFITISPN